LALFGKFKLDIMLTGITNDSMDVSVDYILNILIPIIKKTFAIEGDFSLKIHKRGFRPDGGGEIELKVP